jgi:hypothetical protein
MKSLFVTASAGSGPFSISPSSDWGRVHLRPCDDECFAVTKNQDDVLPA